MEPLVSIIVPIYNVEPYLRRCVDSIINQTYRNLEIILVDDGSTDNSHKICDEYKEKDCRVKVIHKPNGGQSEARNVGLDNISGDYVTFIDSDDWYEKDTIETILLAAIDNNVEIVSYGSNIVNQDNCCIKAENPQFEKITFREYLRLVFLGQRSPSVCTKLYSRETIENENFILGRVNEDFYFSSRIFLKDGLILTIPFVGYNYYQRAGSTTHSGDNNKPVSDAVRNCMEIYETVREHDSTLLPALAKMALHQASVLIRIIPEKHITKENEKLKLSSECIDLYIPYIKQSGLSLYETLIVKLAHKAPTFAVKFMRVVRKFRK